MKLKRITYEWEDGKTLALTLEQWMRIWSFVSMDDEESYQRCIRFLVEHGVQFE